MIKAVVVIVALALLYFFFIKSELPEYVYDQDELFGPGNLQKSNDSQSTMSRYNSASNSDYLLILKPDKDSAELSDFAELFSSHFSKQGFRFKTNGGKMVGIRQDGVIYRVSVLRLNILVMLVIETTEPVYSFTDADEIFTGLSEIRL